MDRAQASTLGIDLCRAAELIGARVLDRQGFVFRVGRVELDDHAGRPAVVVVADVDGGAVRVPVVEVARWMPTLQADAEGVR